MAIVQESYTAIQEGTETTSFGVTHPTGLATGDCMLACIAKDDDPAMSDVTGWTRTSISHTDCCINIFRKIATASDVSAGSTTFTGDSEQYVGRLYRYSGVHSDIMDVIDTTGVTGETGSSPFEYTVTSVTTVTNNAVAFVVSGNDDDDEPYSIVTGGWTTDFYNESINGSGVNGTAGIIVGYKSMATAGATGGCVLDQKANEGYAALQFALKPASTATTYTKTASMDMAVQDTKTKTASMNMAVQDTKTASVSNDLAVQETNSANISFDMGVQAAVVNTSSLDMAVQDSISKTLGLDMNVTVVLELLASLDMAIQSNKTLTNSFDMYVSPPYFNVSFDMYVYDDPSNWSTEHGTTDEWAEEGDTTDTYNAEGATSDSYSEESNDSDGWTEESPDSDSWG